MSDDKITFLPYEQAINLVGAIQEEEDIERPNKRILTVYSKKDKELCWFDFEETLAAVGEVNKADKKEAVQNYVLNHIPDWVLEI
ncbi:hypothetical protein [Desulfosediminicola flagellatus]|uniref:hypothetical protein n=1 Tax=Desulfosediminicola flagellatus TaxID=2569541 RepID=UPI0010AD8237|nr:hypothetical protein [Desulfosediminicola flagellatus]